jgi:hypothetical protein
MGTSPFVAAGAHHRSIRACGHNGHCRAADRTMANECLISIPQKAVREFLFVLLAVVIVTAIAVTLGFEGL